MLDSIAQADTWLFLRLNAGAANAFFDWLMPIVTESHYWMPFVIGGLLAIAVFGGGRGRGVVLVAILLFTITDQVSSHVIKPLVSRPRPCHDVEATRLLYRCGGTFSFPSSHAVNAMAAAIFFGLIYRRWLWPLIALAVLVSYSRIYLGIHYPFDMLAGWIFGGGLAWVTVQMFEKRILAFLSRYRLFQPVVATSNSGIQT